MLNFTCVSGCPGMWSHAMTITSFAAASGAFTGTGTSTAYPDTVWSVSGILSGGRLTYTIVYTGANAGYTVNGSGTIAADGWLSGTATGPGQSFTWTGSIGSFGTWSPPQAGREGTRPTASPTPSDQPTARSTGPPTPPPTQAPGGGGAKPGSRAQARDSATRTGNPLSAGFSKFRPNAFCPVVSFAPVPEGCPPPIDLGAQLADLGSQVGQMGAALAETGLPVARALAGLLLLALGTLYLYMRRQ